MNYGLPQTKQSQEVRSEVVKCCGCSMPRPSAGEGAAGPEGDAEATPPASKLENLLRMFRVPSLSWPGVA